MPTKPYWKLLTLAFALACAFVFTAPARALTTEQVLHSFNYNDGTNPQGGLTLDSAGNLYGAATWNGPTGAGTLFELLPNGSGQWGYEELYNFCSAPGCPDGAVSQAGVIFDVAGNLYGTTSQGGNFGCGHGCGTVFELTPGFEGGWTEKVLYTFSGGSDGATPVSNLVMDSVGNLYGTTSAGGPNSIYCSQGCGVIFRLHPEADGNWTQKVLHSFCSSTGCLDGAVPNGLALDAAGNLYCTTSQLGRYSSGTLLELIPNQNHEWSGKLLHTFGSGSDGISPNPGLAFDEFGNLYGTTNKGGEEKSGVVFELSPDVNGQWHEKVLHTFCSATNCRDGALPEAGLTLGASGHLYGTTFTGGTTDLGTIFVLSPQAEGHWSYTVLYDSFSGNLNEQVTVDKTGNLFSATSTGGQYYLGSVFEIIP